MTFLDVTVGSCSEVLTTTIYKKDTDRNTILHYRSSHPQCLKENLPYGQLLRIRRNCTEVGDFDIHATTFCNEMAKRGYPKKLLKHSMKRARFTPRDSLLQTKNKKELDKLVCVTTFGPHTNQFKSIILKNWHLLENLEYPLKKPIFAMRKNTSIGQQLIRADSFIPKPKSDLIAKWKLKPVCGHHKCGNCVSCPSTIEGNLFDHNAIKWKHDMFTTCKTKNVVYAVVCPCNRVYIGKTCQAVNVRITQHRSRIKKKVVSAPMVEHFIEKNHDANDFKWTVLTWIDPRHQSPNIESALLRKEAYLIMKFDSINKGLNCMSELSRV